MKVSRTGVRVGAAVCALGLSLAGPQALGVAAADGTDSPGTAASGKAAGARGHAAGPNASKTRRTPAAAATRTAPARTAQERSRNGRAAAAVEPQPADADPLPTGYASLEEAPGADEIQLNEEISATQDNPAPKDPPIVEPVLVLPDRGGIPEPWWRSTGEDASTDGLAYAAPPPVVVSRRPTAVPSLVAQISGQPIMSPAPQRPPFSVSNQIASFEVMVARQIDHWISTLPSGGGLTDVVTGALLLIRRTLAPNVAIVPGVSVTKSAVVEPVSGSTDGIFTVTLDRAYTAAVTVGYSTGVEGVAVGDAVDIATAGADYTTASGLLTFAPGQTSQQVTVTVLADGATEKTEMFTLRVFATTKTNTVTGVVLGSGLGTIFEDGNAASVTSSTVDLSRWMETLSGVSQLPLTKLPIPGTHDAGSYSITAASPWAETRTDLPALIVSAGSLPLVGPVVKSVIAGWAKAQPTDIFRQFVDGIRDIDLRPTYEPDGKIYIEHTLLGPSMDEVLADIELFAMARPKEVLFVQMSRFKSFTPEVHAELLAQIRKVLGPRLVDDRLGTSATSEDIWATGKNIVLIYEDSSISDANSDVWPGVTIYQPWPQVQTVGPLLEKDRQFLKERDPASIWGLSGTVTPDTLSIVKGLFPFQLIGPNSLQSLMKQVHPSVQDWLRGEFKDSINLVTTDWYNAKWARGSYVRDILGSVDGDYL